MAIRDDGRLAIRETLKLAWRDVMAFWKPGLALTLLLYVPFIVLYLSGMMDSLMVPSYIPSVSEFLGGLLGYVLIMLFACAIYVLFIRLFLIGPEHAFRITPTDLSRYTLRFIWKGIQLMLIFVALMLVLTVPLIIGSMMFGLMFGMAGMENSAGIFVSLLLPFFMWLAVMAIIVAVQVRLYPTFFGAAVGQVIRFRESWRTMHGYTWRTALALIPPMLVMLLPYFIVWVIMMRELMTAMSTTGAPTTVMMNLWWLWLLMIPVAYVSYGWAAGVLAHLYRDLWPAPPQIGVSFQAYEAE